MTPLQRAIAICGTQSELARRVKGKPATGHVYHWLKNGVTAEDAVAIEKAVAAAMAEDPLARARAADLGGPVSVEDLLPDLIWARGADGAVVSFTTRIDGAPPDPARRTPAAPEGGDAAQTDAVPVQPVSRAA